MKSIPKNLEVLKLEFFVALATLNFVELDNFSLPIVQKIMNHEIQYSETQDSPILISRKILVTEKFCNLHDVFVYCNLDFT